MKGNDNIRNAAKVSVRVHSECLTGDVFYSRKCDCGDQKLKYLQMMENEQHAVFVYIKGHEGRGNGLYNKISSYSLLDNDDSKTHIDTLHELGCPSDVRQYKAAFLFLKNKLQIKSLKLFSNNPLKIEAARETFGSANVTQCPMPASEFTLCVQFIVLPSCFSVVPCNLITTFHTSHFSCREAQQNLLAGEKRAMRT